MTQDEGPLIEIPEDGPDWQGLAQDMPIEGTGDLGPAPELGGAPAGARRSSRAAGSARAEVAYLRIVIPEALTALYPAWEAAQEREGVRREPLPEGREERWAVWLLEAVGRDADADDIRPEEDQQYDFPSFFGESFHSLLRQYAGRQHETQLRPELRRQRQLFKQRIREQFPDWSDEDVEQLLGPSGEEA